MSTGTEAAVETNVQLRKLSAADFRVYNHMAEAMEYYVSKGHLVWGAMVESSSITISDKPGKRSIPLHPVERDLQGCPSSSS